MTQGLSEKVGTGFSVRQADTKNVPALRFPEFEGEWEETRLGELDDLVQGDGNWILSENISENAKYQVVQLGNIGLGSFIHHKKMKTIDQENFDLVKGTLIQQGDILINRMVDGNVYCCIFDKSGDYVTSVDVCWIRSASSINNEFLIAFLLNQKTQNNMLSLSSGSGRVRISKSNLFEKLPLLLPSLPEQEKIAAFMGVVDAKITALRARRAGLERYKRGLMQALFSQTLRFTKPDGSAFPDWEEKRLGDLGRFTGGGTPDTNISEYWSGEIPWISSSDVVEGDLTGPRIGRWITEAAIKESATKVVPAGSILIVSRVGVGKLTVATCDLCTSQDFTNFIPKSDNVMFLGYWMVANTNALLRLCQGTSIKGLTSDDLKTLQVPIPHPDEQAKIAEALSAMDAKIAAVGDQVSRMEAFKKGLLQQMFV